MVQPDGRHAPGARSGTRPEAADRAPAARPRLHGLLPRRQLCAGRDGHGARQRGQPAAQALAAPASLWRGAAAAAFARRHRGGTGGLGAARLRGQRLARDPHAADGAGRLRGDAADPGPLARGTIALPRADGAAIAAHADAGQRPAHPLAAGGQPPARRGRVDAAGQPVGAMRAGRARAGRQPRQADAHASSRRHRRWPQRGRAPNGKARSPTS